MTIGCGNHDSMGSRGQDSHINSKLLILKTLVGRMIEYRAVGRGPNDFDNTS